MKIYLGIGTDPQDYGPILRRVGAVSVLYSYINIMDGRIPVVFEDMMIDSGAFSALTQGTKISLDAYILWLELYLPKYPQIRVYVNLDDISDPQKTIDNQKRMEAAGLKPLPCYHYGEPDTILDDYAAKYEYIGLGGFAARRLPAAQFQKFWEYVYERYKDNKFHIFGINTFTPFYRYQPHSIDSVSYIHWVSHFQLPGYKDGLPDILDISENGTGWLFLVDWRELAAISARTVIDWQGLKWLKYVDKSKTDNTKEQSRLL